MTGATGSFLDFLPLVIQTDAETRERHFGARQENGISSMLMPVSKTGNLFSLTRFSRFRYIPPLPPIAICMMLHNSGSSPFVKGVSYLQQYRLYA